MRNLVDRRTFLSSSAVLLIGSAAAGQIKIPGVDVFRPANTDNNGGDGSLADKAKSFQRSTASGTKNLVTALSEVAFATGQKEEGVRLKAQADSLRWESISQDQFVSKNQMIVDSSIRPEVLAGLSTNLSVQAQEELKQSFIHFKIGAFNDKDAATIAQKLATAMPSPADLANGMVASATAVAKTATGALPRQIATSVSWMNALGQYFKVHGIKMPTAADAQQVAAAQGMPPDKLAEFPKS